MAPSSIAVLSFQNLGDREHHDVLIIFQFSVMVMEIESTAVKTVSWGNSYSILSWSDLLETVKTYYYNIIIIIMLKRDSVLNWKSIKLQGSRNLSDLVTFETAGISDAGLIQFRMPPHCAGRMKTFKCSRSNVSSVIESTANDISTPKLLRSFHTRDLFLVLHLSSNWNVSTENKLKQPHDIFHGQIREFFFPLFFSNSRFVLIIGHFMLFFV